MTSNRGVRALRVIGLALLMGVLVVSGYGGWRLYKGLKWVKEQNARGDEFPTLEELLGPPTPDEENAALVYQQAFDAFDLTDEDEKVLSGESDPHHPGRYIYDVPKLAAVIAKNERSLALLQQAAAMPKCQFFDPAQTLGYGFGSAFAMRNAARVQTAQARLLAERGQIAQALSTVGVCLDFGEHAAAGRPSLMSLLVCTIVQRIALRGVEHIIEGQHCSRVVSAQLSTRLAEIDLVRSSMRALEAERAWSLLMLDRIGHEQAPYEQVNWGTREKKVLWPPRPLPLRWAVASTKAHLVYYMNEYLELAPLPYRQSHNEWNALDAEIKMIPAIAGPARVVLPTLVRTVPKRDEARARITLCIVALDLKVHKDDHGGYPQTLDELAESSEQGYAEDVFSGERLKYRREGEGFILYSFGKDLDDDGGLPLGREVNGKPERDNGDLVWRCSK